MIILQINTIVNNGSTGRITEDIGRVAINRGWKSYIAFGRNEKASKSELIKIGSDFDIKFHGLKTRLFDMQGFGSKHATLKLVELIKEIKPDVIQLHNLHGYYINIEVLFNYLATSNIPVVWTLHDCWSFTGHCIHFDSIHCDKWETECFSCPQKNMYPTSFFKDNSKQNYFKKKRLFNSVRNLTIVPVSNWLGSVVDRSFLKSFPQKIISNGVDLDCFFPRFDNNDVRNELGIGNRFMLLGVASNWNLNKGLTDFVKLSKIIDVNTVIVLIGLDDTQIKCLPVNIIGLKKMDDISNLAQIYSAADIVLNLSAEETFGMTTVEGFACGTPGIVYNCTASPELISSSTGLIVEKNNIQNLADAISEMKGNGKFYYSAACRKHAEIYYNRENRYKEYIDLYENLFANIK